MAKLWHDMSKIDKGFVLKKSFPPELYRYTREVKGITQKLELIINWIPK